MAIRVAPPAQHYGHMNKPGFPATLHVEGDNLADLLGNLKRLLSFAGTDLGARLISASISNIKRRSVLGSAIGEGG